MNMKNKYDSQLFFWANKLYYAHPQLLGRLMKGASVSVAILNVLGVCGSITLLFAGQWRLALLFLVIAFVGRFALGLVLSAGHIIFAFPAFKLTEKGGFCRVLSIPLCFLASMFNGFVIWYFNMLLFKTALVFTEDSGGFVIICAVLASYVVGADVFASIADKNSVVDNINLIFYHVVIGLLYVLFICSVLSAPVVIVLCLVAVLLKAITETTVLIVLIRE